MQTSYVVHSFNEDREHLVFGLSWAVVVGHRPDREAVSVARKARASHYVPPGSHSSVVGYVRFPRRSTDQTGLKLVERLKGGKSRQAAQSSWFSAAQTFADRFPKGVHAFVLKLSEERYWLVASQDGEVIPGNDRVYDTASEAEQALTELRKEYKNVTDATAEEVNLRHPTTAARLVELKHPLLALPSWMRWGAAAVGAVFFMGQVPAIWQSLTAGSNTDQPVQVQVDAAAAWKKQLDQWQKTVRLDGINGFQALLRDVGSVPMKMGGWSLTSVDCSPYPVGWKCSGIYDRGAAGSRTNSSLVSELPAGWTVQWQKIDKAKVNWAFAATRSTLDRAALEDRAVIDGQLTSQIQAIYAAFKVAVISDTSRADVPVPTYIDSEGQQVAVPYSADLPAGSRIPALMSLEFEGPLRSMTVLPLTASSVIKNFNLQVQTSKEPALATSPLTAKVKGMFYVQ
jgi:hypothetical protein